jgi:nucleoside-diphosphate-sugar epimerase
MKIAVTGATGYVGGFIVDALLDAGHEVRVMVRPGGMPAPTGVESHTVALDPDSDFRPLLHGADVLVHAAFRHEPGRYRLGEGDDLAGFLRANVAGSLALVDQALRLGVGRAVLFSSRAVYGKREAGTILTEDMAVRPDTHYGAAKATLEAFASSHARQDGWPVCALRPTGVYGLADPIERSKWYGLVGNCLADRPVPARGGTEVHGADVAASVLCLLQAPENDIAGQAFNCSDLYVSTRDIAALVQARSGRDIPLPDEPEDRAAFNMMDCAGLSRLGMTFGGIDRLRQTVDALTDHRMGDRG